MPRGNLTKVSPVRDDEPFLPVLQPCRMMAEMTDVCTLQMGDGAIPLRAVGLSV